MSALVLLPLAFCLDLLLGDPHSWPHPVRFIGHILTRLEPPGQALAPAWRRLYGLGVVLALGSAVFAVVGLLVSIPVLGWLLGLYLAYAGLALGQLLREAKAVAALIRAGRLSDARKALSYLVSRDTATLSESDLWRTLSETVAENFCDAFVAPALYLYLGGPQMQWLYKTVSTMDSMWGYKTGRFRDLGWAGARADDLLAYIPARISALLLIVAGFFLGLPAMAALRSVRADAGKMSSPNAGWPMAAAAWLCGGTMGGAAEYFGEMIEKPLLGPPQVQWNGNLFSMLIRLELVAGCILVAAIPTLALTFSIIFS